MIRAKRLCCQDCVILFYKKSQCVTSSYVVTFCYLSSKYGAGFVFTISFIIIQKQMRTLKLNNQIYAPDQNDASNQNYVLVCSLANEDPGKQVSAIERYFDLMKINGHVLLSLYWQWLIGTLQIFHCA